MTPEFIKLTNRDGGSDLFIRRDMVATVGSYRGATHVTLINEDIDYEVKESPAEVLALISVKVPHGSLTNENQCGTISRAKEKQSCSKRSPEQRGSPGSGS